MEFSRQRILESAAIPYSRGLSRPRDWTSSLESPALAGWFFTTNTTCCCCSVIKSRPALQSHGLQLTRLLCSSLSHGVCSNLCPLSQWCCPTISCSVTPFSSCPQSFLAPGYFPLSWLCTSGGQTIGVSASVLPMNIQGWFPLGLTGLISLRSKGLWRVFSNTTTGKHWFFGVQPSLWFNSYISHDYWKNHSFDYSFVSKVMSLLFNTLSRFVIAFFPRSKCIFISWLLSLSAVVLEPSLFVPIFSLSVCPEVMGLDVMILVFWMLSFKPAFSLLPSSRGSLVRLPFCH